MNPKQEKKILPTNLNSSADIGYAGIGASYRSDSSASKSMEIIAHRGNLSGKDLERENSYDLVRSALEHGFGVETDIRWADKGGFYISHDAASHDESNDAVSHAALWREFPSQVIALNIKELGYEKRMVEFLRKTGLKEQVFLFDMELLERVPGETARTYSQLSPGIRLAARVSDRNEPIDQALALQDADVIWLDEFDRMWVEAADVARLKQAGKIVYAVSPELHGFPFLQTQKRWDEFASWGVNGICTDYPLALCRHLGTEPSYQITGKDAR